MTLVAQEASSRWQQIAQQLRDDIATGRLPPGAQLPNETQLAERFAVHRHTLRQAVRQLSQEGFVRVRQGRGTFVRELVLDYTLQRRTRMTENLAEAGERATRELLRHETVRGGEWARLLGLRPQDSTVLLHTRASVRGRPIGLATTAYPCPQLAGMAEAFAATGSVSQALRSLGVADYQRARSTVSCRLPTREEADLLARSALEPVLEVKSFSHDGHGRRVEAGCTLFAADAVQLSVEHAA